MDATNFCYWLQGYSEICGKAPNQDEWQVILDHLKIAGNPEPISSLTLSKEDVLGEQLFPLQRSAILYC